VATTFTIGHPSKGEKSGTMQSVISFIIRVDFPNNADVERMEGKALNAIFDLNETGSSFRLEVQAERSAVDEQATPSRQKPDVSSRLHPPILQVRSVSCRRREKRNERCPLSVLNLPLNNNLPL
jgi:hypothetical protein